MKSIYRLLASMVLLVSISTYGQLTAGDIGVPQNVYDSLKTVVFHSQFEQCSERAPGHAAIELTKLVKTTTVNGVTKTTTSVVLRESRYRKPGIRENVGVYALNLVSWFINDHGYNNVEQTDSGFVFSNKIGSQLIIWHIGPSWYSKVTDATRPLYGFTLTDPITQVTRYYPESEMLTLPYCPRGSMKPISVTRQMLVDWSQNYRIGIRRDPTKYVCNIFTTVSRLSGNTYRGNIYVNGIDIANITEQTLITSFGKTGMTFTPRWRYVNGCVPGDGGSSPGYEYGNGGECYWTQGTIGEYQNTTVEASDHFSYSPDVVMYNSDKKFILWFQAETFQAQGKNESDEAFFNVTENRVQQTLNN